MSTTTEPLVFDAPTVVVYRATEEATQRWMAARETLLATRERAEEALLVRWGIGEHACVEEHHALGWAIHGTGERPPGCRPVSIDDEPAWAPDTDTTEGQRLVAQLDGLPPALEAGPAEVVLGLPGRMPFTCTRPDGSQVRRQALALEGRMYLCWEQEIDDTVLDLAVWERVDQDWWRATRREMHIDRLADRLGRTVRNHVHYRHAHRLLDELLTLASEVAQRSRDQGVLTGVQAAMDRAQDPIRELIIRDRIARGIITTRLSPAADTDPGAALEQTITQVHALHADLLASV